MEKIDTIISKINNNEALSKLRLDSNIIWVFTLLATILGFLFKFYVYMWYLMKSYIFNIDIEHIGYNSTNILFIIVSFFIFILFIADHSIFLYKALRIKKIFSIWFFTILFGLIIPLSLNMIQIFYNKDLSFYISIFSFLQMILITMVTIGGALFSNTKESENRFNEKNKKNKLRNKKSYLKKLIERVNSPSIFEKFPNNISCIIKTFIFGVFLTLIYICFISLLTYNFQTEFDIINYKNNSFAVIARKNNNLYAVMCSQKDDILYLDESKYVILPQEEIIYERVKFKEAKNL